MTQKPENKANIINSVELRELLGPPPVLSSEDLKAYDDILARVMECFDPKDFLEQLLIKQWVDDNWESLRYRRHKMLAVERKFRQIRAFQVTRVKAQAQTKDAKSHDAQDDRNRTTFLGRMDELEDIIENTSYDIDALKGHPATELDHARALQKTIGYHLQLDQSLNTSIARRDDALDQLERYRRGSGKRPRKPSDEIVDVEFNEVGHGAEDPAPALVPASEGSQ